MNKLCAITTKENNFSNMAPLCRTRLAKQQAPQRKRKHKETSNHDSDDKVADTSSSPKNTFHNVNTKKTCF